MMNARSRPVFFGGAALACAIAYSGANAQVLEEVVVTAQKREQSLQDVPLSITALSGEVVTERGFHSLSELSEFTPNLRVDETLTAAVIVSRGIATVGLNPAFEQSTPMFLDGVFMGKSRQANAQLFDVDRVEVLRGPQPTYFGQNAIAGAVTMTSARPGNEWEGYIRSSYGSEAEGLVEAAYGGPISDTFGVRVATRLYTFDGYIDNLGSGSEVPERENTSARVLFEWAPTDRLTMLAKFETYDFDEFGLPEQGIGCNTAGNDFCSLVAGNPAYSIEFERNNTASTGGGSISYDANPTVFGDGFGPFAGLNGATLGILGIVPPGHPAFDMLACPVCGDIKDVSAYPIMLNQDRGSEGDTAMFSIDYDLGGVVFTSQTAVQDFTSKIGFDLDLTAAAGFSSTQLDEQDQFSQEFRLTSPTGGAVEWMVGLYYQQIDFETTTEWISAWDGGQFVAQVAPVAPFRHVDTVSDDEWRSVFGAVTFNISDRFSLDLGARYTEVEKEAVNTGFSLFIDPDNNPATADFGGIIPGSEQRIAKTFEDDSTDPSITANWQLSDNVKFYARWAQGFKAGGFGVGVTIPADDPTTPVDESDQFVFGSEEAESIELGLKSQLLDNRLTFNLALFDTEYTNLQVSAFDNAAVAFTINNAASATSQGIEAEGQYLATDRLALTYGLTILDATYDSFVNAQCSKNETPTNPTAGTCDRTGRDLLYASPWTLTLGADWSIPVSDSMELDFQIFATFDDGYENSDVYIPNSKQDSYEKVDLRLALSPLNGNWEFALYGRNVTDEQVIAAWIDGVANGPQETRLTLGRGSNYGLQFNYFF